MLLLLLKKIEKYTGLISSWALILYCTLPACLSFKIIDVVNIEKTLPQPIVAVIGIIISFSIFILIKSKIKSWTIDKRFIFLKITIITSLIHL